MAGAWSFSRSINPLATLGLLDFICFILLGITGVLLQVYYLPDFTASYSSVVNINDKIPFGFEIRNLHYWLANFMIVLAVAHFFYLYFKRSYRLKNEVLWTTGILTGLLTIFAAYTGYVLIMNKRAMFAVDIGVGILGAIHPSLSDLLTGSSLVDTVVRIYSLHVVIIPSMMVVLFLLHFPRRLVVNAPAALAMIGAVFLAGGMAPAALGSKFVQTSVCWGNCSQITIPEWYLTGLYAILRTGVPVLVASVVLPMLFVFTFVLIPFYDRAVFLGLKGHIIHAAVGLIAIANLTLVTIWGFRGGDLLHPITSAADLSISPALFYSSLASMAIVIVVGTGSVFAAAHLLSHSRWSAKISLGRIRETRHSVSSWVLLPSMCVVFALQLALYAHVFFLRSFTLTGVPMVESGLSILCFAAVTYLYRRAF
jgi:ubiquinol-cytochrome c reductase cytochrome b subunit